MLVACYDYVVIEPIFEKTSGSIIIPEGLEKRVSNCYGRVISVGSKYPYDVKRGDVVIFRKDEGTKLDTESGKLLALKSEWILARVKEGEG